MMEANRKAALLKAIESMRPEARELMELAKKDLTTKDGYGVIYNFLLGLDKPVVQQCFLMACIREGYPVDTANQIMQIMGWI